MPLRGHVLWLTPRRARAPGGGSRFGLRASARTAGRPGRPPAGLIRPARSVPQVASRVGADGSPHTEVACWKSVHVAAPPPTVAPAHAGAQRPSSPANRYRTIGSSLLLLLWLFAFAFPRATSVIGRTCRAQPWERLRREAKAGRGLSDEGGARRGVCDNPCAQGR